MKKFTKTTLCVVLSLALMLGSSLTSMAANGTVSYSKHTIKYNTSSTRVYMTANNCGDAFYQFRGTACISRTDRVEYKSQPLDGGNGIWKSSTCVSDEGVYKYNLFSNKIPEINKMKFERTTNQLKGFTTLIQFSYRF